MSSVLGIRNRAKRNPICHACNQPASRIGFLTMPRAAQTHANAGTHDTLYFNRGGRGDLHRERGETRSD